MTVTDHLNATGCDPIPQCMPAGQHVPQLITSLTKHQLMNHVRDMFHLQRVDSNEMLKISSVFEAFFLRGFWINIQIWPTTSQLEVGVGVFVLAFLALRSC